MTEVRRRKYICSGQMRKKSKVSDRGCVLSEGSLFNSYYTKL